VEGPKQENTGKTLKKIKIKFEIYFERRKTREYKEMQNYLYVQIVY